MKYTHSCDYVPGAFSGDPQTGSRFVGHALLHNTGNVGVKADVTATWFLGGGSKLTDTFGTPKA